jgi:hypothetical protein
VQLFKEFLHSILHGVTDFPKALVLILIVLDLGVHLFNLSKYGFVLIFLLVGGNLELKLDPLFVALHSAVLWVVDLFVQFELLKLFVIFHAHLDIFLPQIITLIL